MRTRGSDKEAHQYNATQRRHFFQAVSSQANRSRRQTNLYLGRILTVPGARRSVFSLFFGRDETPGGPKRVNQQRDEDPGAHRAVLI